MRWFALLAMSIKRLRSHLGLAALLLLANATTVAVVVCVPVFADAVSRTIMKEELGFQRLSRRPPFAVRFTASATLRRPLTVSDADMYRDWLAYRLERAVGLPVETTIMQVSSSRYDLLPVTEDGRRYTEVSLGNASVFFSGGIGEHIRIIDGEPYDEAASSSPVRLWIERSFAEERAFQVGEEYALGDAYDSSIAPLRVRIAGIWEAIDRSGAYWYVESPWHLDRNLLVSRPDYEAHIAPRMRSGVKHVFWYYIFDESHMNLSEGEHYIAALEEVAREATDHLPLGTMEAAPTLELERGQERKAILSLIFFGFNVPLLAIVLYFIGAVSAVLATSQSQEFALLTSRGASRTQVLSTTLLDALLVFVAAVPVGIAAGMATARLLGYSYGFLHFVPREPLQVNDASIDWRLIAACLVLTIAFRLAPAWSAARRSIVQHEHRSARRPLVWSAGRLLLMGVLAVATAYSYRQLALRGSLSLVSWRPDDATHDPLLLLAPSLFFLTAPLLLSEVFVVLVRPVTWVGRYLRSVEGYLGCLHLGREGGRYRIPVYMLLLCLSISVFYASLAYSADVWLVDRRRYEIGADLTFQPQQRGQPNATAAYRAEDGLIQIPISDYEAIPGVRAAAPVGDYRATLAQGTALATGRLLAVDRTRFAQVAYFRDDYASEPLGELMNRLAVQPDGVLIPARVAESMGIGVGDRVRINVVFNDDERAPVTLTVMGLFDYFPTMLPRERSVFVANHDHIQDLTGGALPFGIWIRVEPGLDGADAAELALAVERRVLQALEATGNLPQTLAEDQARLERVGMFGMLSVSFAAGALLSALALLLQGGVATQERAVRFAVLQALGLTRGHVVLAVMVEYALMLGFAVAVGIGLGIVGGRLYVPLVQLSEIEGVPVPPYLPLIDRQRAALIALTMTGALLAAQGIFMVRLVRAKVFSVLRLGARE
jgi:putative ABC transport system permease protein